MNKLYQGNKWVLLIRGLLAVILGIIMLMNIQSSVIGLLIFFGYYMIIEGLIKLTQGYVQRKAEAPSLPIILGGLGSVILGVLVFFFPGISAIILIALVATNALIQGVSDLTTGISSRDQLSSGWFWWLMFVGIAQIIFGIWIAFQPVIGGLTVVAVIGIYAFVVGLALIIQAFLGNSSSGSSGLAATA